MYIQDHSKWAVVKDKDVCCYCGLNRQDSQMSRYGGCVCFEQHDMYKAMADTIVGMESCDN